MKKMILILALFISPALHAIEVEFEEAPGGLPLVYLNVAVKTGFVTDPADKLGVSNFVGEMLLRGTKSRTKEQIDLALDQMGARIGVETRAESLIVRGAVLQSELKPFLDLVRELITEPSFPESEIRKLKSEMISAILQRKGNDASIAHLKFEEFLFRGHPYGKPVLGKVEDIQKLTRAEIATHYERLFTDKQLLIVGTGKAQKSLIDDWAKEIARLRPDGEVFRNVPAPEPAKQRRLLIVDKPDRTQTQIYIGQLGVRMTDKDYFPLYIGNYVFGGGSFSSRMMDQIRKQRGWSYGAYSSFRHGTEPRLWSLYLFPATQYTPEALKYTLGMVEKLRKEGITQAEFDFAKKSLIASAGFMYNTPRKRVENALLEETLRLPDGFIRSMAEQLEKVTLAEVNASLKRFLRPENLSITVLATAQDLKEPLAKAAGVPLKDVQVVPYTEE